MKIIIPARKNSKGLPFKNRKLLIHTLDKIPKDKLKDVVISSDDDFILEQAKNFSKDIFLLKRNEDLAKDTTSTKSVLKDVIDICGINDQETILMLYLTYPERTWKDIESAILFFSSHNSNSLLCKKEVQTHPFLMLYELEDNKGKQLVNHNLYRRQDYPKCFEISHFICIFKAKEIKNLNENLYNDNTIYFPINNVIDVDYQKDLETYNDKNNS